MLPLEVNHLYEWLQSDPLRKIKADPIVAYYSQLRQALQESFRVLLPGGLAIYVIGKESVFYTFKTREVLYRVDCAAIFRQLAEAAGLLVEGETNVELDKGNKNARPRALDSYYETVFLLRKPIAGKRVVSQQSVNPASAIVS